MKIHQILIVFLLFFSCKKSIKNNINVTSSENKISHSQKKLQDKFINLPKETFYISGNCILFLKPSKEYFNEFLKNEEGIEEVASKFDDYINQFYKDQKNNYNIYFVDQREVALINSQKDTLKIDRYNKKLIYGTIIQNNDSVQVLEGVQTDADIKMALGIFNPEK